jgi:hypothetical protein
MFCAPMECSPKQLARVCWHVKGGTTHVQGAMPQIAPAQSISLHNCFQVASSDWTIDGVCPTALASITLRLQAKASPCELNSSNAVSRSRAAAAASKPSTAMPASSTAAWGPSSPPSFGPSYIWKALRLTK